MTDVVDRVRQELEARIAQLRPLVGELKRLERAAAALAQLGATRAAGALSAPACARRHEVPAQAGRSRDARHSGRAYSARSISARGDGTHARARRRETAEPDPP